jgi:hypothetical protein
MTFASLQIIFLFQINGRKHANARLQIDFIYQILYDGSSKGGLYAPSPVHWTRSRNGKIRGTFKEEKRQFDSGSGASENWEEPIACGVWQGDEELIFYWDSP